MDFIKKHKWTLLAAGSVLLIGLILVLRGGGEKESALADKDPASAMNFYMNLFSSSDGKSDIDPSKVDTFEVERRNFIRKVHLEKETVCAGDDFEVRVDARDPDGREKDLIFKVAEKVGNPVILKYYGEGTHDIVVTVRDYTRIDTKTVTVNVVNCPDRPLVFMKATPHPMRPEEGEFEVVKMEGFTGKTSYLWDFGDGTTKKTETGYATHNYFARDQKRFHSTFTVKVTVTDEKNTSATARATIDFPNVQWISSQMGAATIPISYNRFPVNRDGAYTVDVNMKNIHSESLSFGDAEVEYVSCDSERPPEVRAYGAGALLSQTSIARNAVANSTLTLAGGMMPKSTCNVTIKLKGSTQSGKAVNAALYLTIPVSNEDLKYKKHQVVEDPELDRKIQQAKKILGKDFVTVDELRTLEKEGKL
ncbi:MAG: PKD domain-containing protein [Spirochaetes bacterium]|jgi:hypothetical protein|nr:PKD domain-containing protein [Spirochaetota bacterium]